MEEFNNIFEADDLFVDTTTEDVTEESGAPAEQNEAPVTESKGTEAKEEATPKAEPVVFKYNHESKELDAEAVQKVADAIGWDAKTLVENLQKGANYDAFAERVSKDPARQLVSQIATMRGLDEKAVIDNLLKAEEAMMQRRISDEIRKEHPDFSDEAIAELARYRMADQQTKSEQRQQAEEQAKMEEEKGLWLALFKEFPDIKGEALPDSVRNCRANGMTPVEAYLRHQLSEQGKAKAEQENAAAVAEKKKEAAAKSPGSLSANAQGDDADLFLEGFNSIFS